MIAVVIDKRHAIVVLAEIAVHGGRSTLVNLAPDMLAGINFFVHLKTHLAMALGDEHLVFVYPGRGILRAATRCATCFVKTVPGRLGNLGHGTDV